jgi:hypothetical protein
MVERYQVLLAQQGFEFTEDTTRPPDEPTKIYRRPTGYFIGTNSIDEIIQIEFSDNAGVKVQVGADATPDWRALHLLTEIEELNKYIPARAFDFWGDSLRWHESEVPRITKILSTLLNKGFAKNVAEEMLDERKNGIAFKNEVIPIFLSRFPSYPEVIDRHHLDKSILFVDEHREEFVDFAIYSNEFQISVGEMLKNVSVTAHPINYTELDGVTYLLTNRRAVWYNSKKRSTYHPPGDLQRQLELLDVSFDVLEEWFSERRRYRETHLFLD